MKTTSQKILFLGFCSPLEDKVLGKERVHWSAQLSKASNRGRHFGNFAISTLRKEVQMRENNFKKSSSSPFPGQSKVDKKAWINVSIRATAYLPLPVSVDFCWFRGGVGA